MIFEDESSDMISTIEAALIKLSQPLWNVALDGFGNHDPGKGRYEQAKSDWDVIHPGRVWVSVVMVHHNLKVSLLLISIDISKISRDNYEFPRTIFRRGWFSEGS